MDTSWMSEGNCRDPKVQRLFLGVLDCGIVATKSLQKAQQEAKAACGGCPVLDQCRHYAFMHVPANDPNVLAGMTPSERRRARKAYHEQHKRATENRDRTTKWIASLAKETL